MISSWLWTPLTLLAVDNIFDEKNRNRMVWAFIAGLSIACSFFAGHSQIFLYSTLFIVLYTLWFHRRAFLLRNSYMYLTGLCVVYILIAPQMFRIIEWFPQTSRLLTSSAWQSEGFFIPFRHLVQFIAPDYFGNPATLNYWGMWNYGEMVGYVGVGGLLLALIGIGSQTMFWLFMVIISLLFAVASPVAYLPFQLHLPLISSLQPTRLLVIIDFSLSVLAAYGLSAITDTIKHKKAFQWVSVLFLLLVVLWFGAFAPKLFGIPLDKVILIKRNLVVPTVIFIGSGLLLMLLITLKRHNKFLPLLTSCIILFTVVDLFRFGWKFTPFTDTSYFFPTTKIISYLQKQPKPFRIMTTDDRILPPNVNEFYGIESINGYDPLYSSRYEEFAAAMGRGSPNISPPFGFNRILVPKNVQSPLLPLFNVQYVLSFDDLSRMGFQKVLTEGKTMLFVAPNFLPRAYLVEQPIFLINKQAIMNKLYNPAFKPGISAVVEYPVQTINVPLTTSETVEIKRYADDQISFKVSTMVPRLLVVSNSYISGWHAYIDKKATAIYRTNYVFMGVLVPTGSHSVDLIYR